MLSSPGAWVVVLCAVIWGVCGDNIPETDSWAMELLPGVDPRVFARENGLDFISGFDFNPNIFLFQKKNTTELGRTHRHPTRLLEVKWAKNQVPNTREKRISLSDPGWVYQKHMNPALLSTHINVVPAWEAGYKGKGVNIAVVDDGLAHTHADIRPNYQSSLSYDFNHEDGNPYPDANLDTHGTPAAGLAAAASESTCGVGAAYEAGLAGIRILGDDASGPTDAVEARALSYKVESNHIFSCSWGPSDDGRTQEGPGSLTESAMKHSIDTGRNGLGTIYVWAAGNGKSRGDNCNNDGFVNSPYTIAIGAVDPSGRTQYYSESCAMIHAVTPSPAYTTAKGDGSCYPGFTGTSAAAPIAAGAIGVILQANPNLGWRDVQGILAETSSKVDPSDSEWTRNGAGLHINPKYGFGLIDTWAAVQKAVTWRNYPARISLNFPVVTNLNIDGTGTRSMLFVSSSITVEHVQVHFNARHSTNIGEIVIALVSPSGTRSDLAVRSGISLRTYDWTFGTNRHWNERSRGQWTLEVRALSGVGTWDAWTLIIHGH